jgi:hypothetical protein
MGKNTKEKMSPKKVVYIILTSILGTLVGFIAFELLSIRCATIGLLSFSYFWTLILAGAISGFFLGFRWWRIVYIEHRHWSNWHRRKHPKK